MTGEYQSGSIAHCDAADVAVTTWRDARIDGKCPKSLVDFDRRRLDAVATAVAAFGSVVVSYLSHLSCWRVYSS